MNLQREFLFNILFLVLINLLIKPFFIFGIDLAVQNRLPAGDYGLYFTLLNFTYLFQMLNDFGIQNFNNRHVSRHPQLLPKYFPNLLAIKCLLSAVYVGVSLLAAWGLAGYGWRELPLLLILLCNQALAQGILFLRSNISGLGFYRLDSFLSSLDKLLMLVACGVLLWGLPPRVLSAESFALAQTLALALTLLAVGAVLRGKAPLSLRPSWLRNWRAGRPALVFLFRKSAPYALVILLMTAYTRLDAVLLERWLPDGKIHADVYAGAYRLLDAANMLGYLFATLLLPMFARMLKQREDVRALVSVSFKLIWAGSITLAALVYFARADLIQLMMPDRASAYRWETLGVLIWTFVPVSATYIFSTLLTADERLAQMNRFFVAGIVLDVMLNIFLIPRFQALGSAIAALSTQSFIALAMAALCVRYFRFRPSAKGLAQVLGFALLTLGADWCIFRCPEFSWPLKTGLGLAIALAAMPLTGLLDLRRLRAFGPPEGSRAAG
ncbi:MAG: polysaccharide biosynthesis C-terminal domain-containing protein [Saprospirales bacterium]|jgi:O-antigen/teichoic acid export membrane protein|nr:polysaccharide biosynthesis C-terminal domain-containing protein [Saprospirales bacterium]MBK8922518.1 polysaccharide biosynthesis C-terminal domain-containing protein [Saprospirales bacterium]